MRSKNMLMLVAMAMLGSMVAADLPAQDYKQDLDLFVNSSNPEQGDPHQLIAGEQMQLVTWVAESGYVGFGIYPDDQQSALFTSNMLLLGLRPAGNGEVVDWIGTVPPNLVGYTFRARAIQLTKQGYLHASNEINLKVIADGDQPEEPGEEPSPAEGDEPSAGE